MARVEENRKTDEYNQQIEQENETIRALAEEEERLKEELETAPRWSATSGLTLLNPQYSKGATSAPFFLLYAPALESSVDPPVERTRTRVLWWLAWSGGAIGA